jgi:hypothetical protein
MSGARTTDDALKQQTPSHQRGRARKDRKRWCGGKVGREHDYAVEIRPNGWGVSRDRPCHPDSRLLQYGWWLCKHALICQKCGRQEDITRQQCPEWKETAG